MRPRDQRESNTQCLEVRKTAHKISTEILLYYKKPYIKDRLVNRNEADFLKILGHLQNYLTDYSLFFL